MKARAIAALLVMVGASACSGTPERDKRPLAASRDASLEARVELASVPNGPESWITCDRAEYRFRFRNTSGQAIRVTQVQLATATGLHSDPLAPTLAPDDPFGPRTRDWLQDLTRGSVPGLVFAAYGTVIFGAAALVYHTADHVMAVALPREKVPPPRTLLPFSLEAGKDTQLQLFFPCPPSRPRAAIAYEDATGEHRLALDMPQPE